MTSIKARRFIPALVLAFILALAPGLASAANRTAWTAGNGAGLTWTTAFNSTDFTGAQPTTGQTILSTVTITNGTALDQFMDYSVVQSIASSTIAAGATISVYLVPLAADGSTYTPALTAGTASSNTLPITPVCIIPLFAAATQTTLTGTCTEIAIPPGTFKLAEQNSSGFTYTSTTQVHDYRTYNIQLNN
jgi:hypothetical protein